MGRGHSGGVAKDSPGQHPSTGSEAPAHKVSGCVVQENVGPRGRVQGPERGSPPSFQECSSHIWVGRATGWSDWGLRPMVPLGMVWGILVAGIFCPGALS